ncbi:MAG: prolyl oligopeptidase family serine peptidase [Chitinophagaceae bacterium]
MKLIYLFLLIFIFVYGTFGQKPYINNIALKTWPVLANPQISNNGEYVLYEINNKPAGSKTLVIQSTCSNWKKEFIGANSGIFTGDNKLVVFKIIDTLFYLRLGSDSLTYSLNVSSYKLALSNDGEWLAYQLNNLNKGLIVRSLTTDKEQHFPYVTDYNFENNGKTLLLKTESRRDSVLECSFQWVSLSQGTINTIWSDSSMSQDKVVKINRFRFDGEGDQLVFIVQVTKMNKLENSIWYYKVGMDKAVMKVNDGSPGIDEGLSIENSFSYFSKDGQWIYFQLKHSIDTMSPKRTSLVDVWNYKDIELQSTQLNRTGAKTIRAAISTKGDKVIRLEKENESVLAFSSVGGYVLINDKASDFNSSRNSNEDRSFYLLSLHDGSIKLVIKNNNATYFSFSPSDKYLIYYDKRKKCYLSYEIRTGKTYNFSQSISCRIYNEYTEGETYPVGIGGWLALDSALLVYDEYDIWQVDPKASKSPINITNGYGRSHQLKLVLVGEPGVGKKIIKNNEPLLLTAFNPITMDNGFLRKVIGEKGNPEILCMGSYTIYIDKTIQTPTFSSNGLTMRPRKARDSNIWIVIRESANESPNYFCTKDFKTYTPLTNLQPQKEYNWLTTELVKWKQLDGTISYGILYKPEDFDLHKKYPIIFNYYEQSSFDLNAFLEPGFTNNEINIPWFVSRGYLVFRPDFHFSISKISNKTNGENAYNSVLSAVQYFSKKPWVDIKKMGLNGHSFGGGITNYLICHTGLFAAAVESAGMSDMVSASLSLDGPLNRPNQSRLLGSILAQGRMGVDLWQRRDLYIRNSPIFYANKVTTALLMMHNKMDPAVPWSQAVELYLALRYLGKKVWMLQYDSGDHGVYEEDAEDYTIRLTQFFDHYLKGAAARKWMTQGIPAKLKGIETGYDLDPSGNCGKDCKVCKMWNEKYRKDSVATMREVKEMEGKW